MKADPPSADPCERIIAEALNDAGVNFHRGDDAYPHLDFYLPDLDLHIEVKQFHSDRIADQMGRAANVIAIQGIAACLAFEALIRGGLPPSAA